MHNSLINTLNISFFDVFYIHTCTYNHLPEDEPSGFKHVEDMKKLIIKIMKNCVFRWFILYNHKIKFVIFMFRLQRTYVRHTIVNKIGPDVSSSS